MRRLLLLFVLPTFLVLGAIVAPLVTGERTLVLRDVLNSHLSLKIYQAEAMRRGEFPLVDPLRAGGQALTGNLNALPFYPTNLLFLLGPTLWALNLHFVLHWLIAPLAMYWLARRFDLSPPAAWTAGVLYAFSGFFASQLNFYNLVGGVALAPALAAAALGAAVRTPRQAAVFGLLWSVVILAGDPMIGLAAMVAALSAVVAKHGRRAAWGLLAFAGALGTLAAAPQIVETARILPLSYRGHWGFELSGAGAFDPRAAIDWLVPFAFGRPDRMLLWGSEFFGGTMPLFFTLAPGLLLFVLVAASGFHRSRLLAWAWGAIAMGLLLATESPLSRALFALPGGALMRLPVKFWLLVTLGTSLLAGIGADRLLARRGESGARVVLATLAALLFAFWLGLSFAPEPARQLLAGIMDEALPSSVQEAERLRWAGLCLLSLVTSALLAAGLRLVRWRGEVGLAVLVALHAISQAFFLHPAWPTDRSAGYLAPPPILAALPRQAVLAHATMNDLFGGEKLEFSQLPEAHVRGLERYLWTIGYPWAGMLDGRRYEFNYSPEGLDPFVLQAIGLSLAKFDDTSRLRVLAATGVEVLLSEKPLSDGVLERAERIEASPQGSAKAFVYRLLNPLLPVALVGEVRAAPHMNAALQMILAADFDPRRAAVVPGEAPPRFGAPGEAKLLVDEAERIEVAVSAPNDGLLVVRRAYLPLYRATVDGEPAKPILANLTRLALAVPAGEHRVVFWVDRRPFYAALGVAALALVGLLLLALRRPRGAKIATVVAAAVPS